MVRGAAPDPTLKAITRETVAGAASRAHAVSPALREKAVRATAARRAAIGQTLLPRQSALPLRSARAVPRSAGGVADALYRGRNLDRDRSQRHAFARARCAASSAILHDFDFDVRRALASGEMRAEVGAIPGANCWCTHSCFIQDSSKFSAKVQLLAKFRWRGCGPPFPTLLVKPRRRQNSPVTDRLTGIRILAARDHRRRMTRGLRSIAVGEDLREFRSEEKDLTGIIDPHDEYNDGSSGAIARCKTGLAQIESNQEFTDCKQERGHTRAQEHVPPFYPRLRHNFVDRSEHSR